MDDIYFNVIKDIEGLFGDNIVVFSSHKTFVESNFRASKIDAVIGKILSKETDNVYTIEEGNTTKEIEEFLVKSLFIKSEALTIFNEDENVEDEEVQEEEVQEEVVTNTEVVKETEDKIETKIETVASLPVGTVVSIKDWKDLTSVQLIYSYLQNYKKIMGASYDSMLFSTDVRYENKVLFDLLLSNKILGQSEIDFLKKHFPETIYTLGHKRKSGSFDNPTDVCIFLNQSILMQADAVAEANAIYSREADFFDNVYFYWMSLYADISVKEAKALVKGTLANVKSLGSAAIDGLFEFEIVEIDSKVSNPKRKSKTIINFSEDDYDEQSTGDYICGILTVNNYEQVGPIKLLKDSRKILVVEDSGFFAENEAVQDPTGFKLTDKTILETLRIRGIDTSNNPHFVIPNHFELTTGNILKLISGINGLVFNKDFNDFLNQTSDEPENKIHEKLKGTESKVLEEASSKIEENIESSKEPIEEKTEELEEENHKPVTIVVNEDESLIIENSVEAEILSKDDLAQMIYDDSDKTIYDDFQGQTTPEEAAINYLLDGESEGLTDCAVITAIQNNLFKYGKVEEDLKKYKFGFTSFACGKLEQTDEIIKDLNKILGVHTTSEGIAYLGACAFDETKKESPLVFIIYFDGADLRAYIPSCGNAINLDTNSAFGISSSADIAYCKKQGLLYDGYVGINSELIIRDIEASLFEII